MRLDEGDLPPLPLPLDADEGPARPADPFVAERMVQVSLDAWASARPPRRARLRPLLVAAAVLLALPDRKSVV